MKRKTAYLGLFAAHIEVFRDGKRLLFDYTDRDPLTNNAQLTDITDEVNNNYGNV